MQSMKAGGGCSRPVVATRPARTNSIPIQGCCAISKRYRGRRPFLAASPVRVLVVDDYEPFWRFVCSILGKCPELLIVGEVSDGLEAIRKAEELRPDLILLDIGLPTLNGIETARHIRRLAQESKIVFVSQESSADVVREAFRLGAMGYVVKTDAGSDLPVAVSAVLRGKTFAGSTLAKRKFTGALSSFPVTGTLS